MSCFVDEFCAFGTAHPRRVPVGHRLQVGLNFTAAARNPSALLKRCLKAFEGLSSTGSAYWRNAAAGRAPCPISNSGFDEIALNTVGAPVAGGAELHSGREGPLRSTLVDLDF
jgi:hypothetical protein